MDWRELIDSISYKTTKVISIVEDKFERGLMGLYDYCNNHPKKYFVVDYEQTDDNLVRIIISQDCIQGSTTYGTIYVPSDYEDYIEKCYQEDLNIHIPRGSYVTEKEYNEIYRPAYDKVKAEMEKQISDKIDDIKNPISLEEARNIGNMYDIDETKKIVSDCMDNDKNLFDMKLDSPVKIPSAPYKLPISSIYGCIGKKRSPFPEENRVYYLIDLNESDAKSFKLPEMNLESFTKAKFKSFINYIGSDQFKNVLRENEIYKLLGFYDKIIVKNLDYANEGEDLLYIDMIQYYLLLKDDIEFIPYVLHGYTSIYFIDQLTMHILCDDQDHFDKFMESIEESGNYSTVDCCEIRRIYNIFDHEIIHTLNRIAFYSYINRYNK